MILKYLATFTIGLAMIFSIAMASEKEDFTLKDHKGNSHNLSDFRGKWVVLEWINFGCPFVKKHYDSDNMQSLQKKYTGKDVVWLSICSSAPGKQGYFENHRLTDILKKHKFAGTAYLIDSDGKVGKQFGAKTTPQMVIINPEGEVVYNGAIDDTPSTDQDDIKDSKNYVSHVLDEVMSGKKAPLDYTKPYGCSVKYSD